MTNLSERSSELEVLPQGDPQHCLGGGGNPGQIQVEVGAGASQALGGGTLRATGWAALEKTMLDFLREAWALAKKKRAEREDRAEKAAIAKAFNDRYTYRNEYRKDSGRFENFAKRGYAWMCPECNAIHAPTDCTRLTGLQYPRCCGTGEGHRLNEGIRT